MLKVKGHENVLHEWKTSFTQCCNYVGLFTFFILTCCLAIYAAAVERFLSPLCLNKYPILWDCSPPCSISFGFFSFVYWSVDKISLDCCYSTALNCAKRWLLFPLLNKNSNESKIFTKNGIPNILMMVSVFVIKENSVSFFC